MEDVIRYEFNSSRSESDPMASPPPTKKSAGKSASARTKPVAKTAPPAPKPAAKPAPAVTIAMKAVFEQLAEGHDLPKKQAHALLAGMVETVTSHLKKGDRIRINGLGILEVRKREARMGRNPATGEAIQIAASKKVAFKPAKELKEAV
jgi:DNA-binding protein HU-beta